MTNTTTKATKAVIPATVLENCMEAIQHDILQHAMENAARYFEELEKPYISKAQTCTEALVRAGMDEDALYPLELALSRYVSIIAWYIYRQGLKDAMQKPALAESILEYTSDDEPPALLDFPSPLYAYDIFGTEGRKSDRDNVYYRLKRPEEFTRTNK